MGIGGRKPVLPAPTESLVDSGVEDTGVSTEVATDISRRTDRTSATIPDDGSPVTISTGAKGKTSRTQNKSGSLSQTSLLIEFYEGQKEPGTNRRPSLRVRVRPSTGKSKDKGQEKDQGYIAVTHESGSRKPSYTQRIPLGSKSLGPAANSTISLYSAPLDIEIDNRGSDISDMSPSPEPRYIAATSDISSMPADSMLGTNSAVAPAPPPVATSSILSNSELDERSDLHYNTPSKERNLSRGKTAQRAFDKSGGQERASSRSVQSSEKSRSRSGSASHEARNAALQERRRKSGKYPEESSISGGTESLISNSVLSTGARSLDDKSVRSGNSNITNPKLLQTVEDAIRRLILPELKEIKRYGSQRSRHQEDAYSDVSDNSIAREKASNRRVASGSSSRRRVSKESGSGSRRRRHHSRDVGYEDDSPSEASSRHGESISSISADRDRRSKSRDKGVRGRDVVAGASTGAALTAAALHHQDSSSTLERRRRRKRSKSQSSRSASIADSEEQFEKPPPVPPMPFRSEIGSDLTRSSLLSSNTADTTTLTQREVRETVRGSPLDRDSSMETTPTQGPGDLRQTLGTHHRNFSGHDLNVHRNSYDEPVEPQSQDDYSPESYHDHSFTFADPERLKAYERNLHQQHPIRRGLSPIQSVASYATTEPNRHSAMHTRSMDSISSLKRRQQLKEEVSVDSFASASPSVQKGVRPQGINLENRSEIMHQHEDETLVPQERDLDKFYDEQHSENNKYRESYASNDTKTEMRRMTTYADDSTDAPHSDKIGRGQQVIQGFSGRPEYVHTPPGVESAVASLIEPSLIDMQPSQSPHQSVTGSVVRDNVSVHSGSHNIRAVKSASPSKDQLSVRSPNSFGKSRAIDTSPPQSPAHSSIADQQEVAHTKQHEDHSGTSPESEITTNPSVIQGPIGGLSAGNRDHWPYGATPDRSMPNNPAQQALNRDLGVHAPDLIPEALNLSQRQPYDTKQDMYSGDEIEPPGAKDEGYATGESPGLYAKRNERGPQYTPDDIELQDDPFVMKRNKYMSGLSQGMSPLYDSATGRGIDRIQSKDVVALMDHLTVRDAQRNARDTEILVTLVRSAAEMRNSFEDMKKFIEEQGGFITATAERQHEKTQRVIGGPRPQPVSNRTTQKSLVSQEEDLPAKRRNIFRRALQGLGSKNATELHNIEQMLMQLLDDVEDLRALQTSTQRAMTPTANPPLAESVGSVENTRAPTDTGYEPDGQAGTSSTEGRSGNLSNQSSRHEYRIIGGQRESGNRVSTVLEGDEDEYDDEYDNHNTRDVNRNTALGSHQVEQQYRQSRGQSLPISTPPKMHANMQGAWSNENTPNPVEPASHRKNKSIASSLMPKFMSRWSKTTVSTEPRFSVQNKARPYSQVSRSGSDLGEYSYEPQPDDRLRSSTSLQEDQYRDQENRPPSPLVPSQVSDNPKYQGYRNSKNLQHPQPRQGPTGRYQTQLENEAQNYHDQFSPTSQTSSHQWDAQQGTRDANRMSQERYQPQPPLSTISDGYSETSDRRSVASSRRHTKIVDDEPLVPQRPPKIPMSPFTYVDHVAAARSGSPAFDKSPVAALRSPQGSGRKPSGPRPYNAASQNGQAQAEGQNFKGDLNTVKKTRFRGSPYHISSNEDVSQPHNIGV